METLVVSICKSNDALFLDLTQRNLLSYSLGSSHFSPAALDHETQPCVSDTTHESICVKDTGGKKNSSHVTEELNRC